MFGIFGCFVYFLFARIAKRAYCNAIYTNDIMKQVLYSYYAAVFIPTVIYTSISWFPTLLTHYLIVYLPVKYYSRIRQ
jgi:hypothetical protein